LADGRTDITTGRYRNIPQLVTLSFVLLGEISGLSVAASLFFLTMAVTHIPLAPSTATKSAQLLTPPPVLLLTPALLSYIWICWLPQLLNSSIWTSLSTLGYFIVPLLLSMLAQPNSLHRVDDEYKSIRAARLSYTGIFRILSWASFSIHAMRTIAYTLETTPPKHEWHHSYVWMTHSAENHTLFDQATMALSKIFGALHGNPVVSMTGWDILLTEIALCSWAVTRGLDVRAMLRIAGLLWSKETSDAISERGRDVGNAIAKRARDATNAVSKKAAHLRDYDEDDDEPPARTLEDEFEDLIHEAEHETGGGKNLRRSTRGRSTGNPKTSAALSSTSPPPSAETTSRARRRTRQRKSLAKQDSEVEEDEEEVEYTPTPTTQYQVASMDVLPESGDDIIEEMEAGALGWGLFIIGGLGVASAGVLGAEVGGGK
jgi:hypothetical protein